MSSTIESSFINNIRYCIKLKPFEYVNRFKLLEEGGYPIEYILDLSTNTYVQNIYTELSFNTNIDLYINYLILDDKNIINGNMSPYIQIGRQTAKITIDGSNYIFSDDDLQTSYQSYINNYTILKKFYFYDFQYLFIYSTPLQLLYNYFNVYNILHDKITNIIYNSILLSKGDRIIFRLNRDFYIRDIFEYTNLNKVTLSTGDLQLCIGDTKHKYSIMSTQYKLQSSSINSIIFEDTTFSDILGISDISLNFYTSDISYTAGTTFALDYDKPENINLALHKDITILDENDKYIIQLGGMNLMITDINYNTNYKSYYGFAIDSIYDVSNNKYYMNYDISHIIHSIIGTSFPLTQTLFLETDISFAFKMNDISYDCYRVLPEFLSYTQQYYNNCTFKGDTPILVYKYIPTFDNPHQFFIVFDKIGTNPQLLASAYDIFNGDTELILSKQNNYYFGVSSLYTGSYFTSNELHYSFIDLKYTLHPYFMHYINKRTSNIYTQLTLKQNEVIYFKPSTNITSSYLFHYLGYSLKDWGVYDPYNQGDPSGDIIFTLNNNKYYAYLQVEGSTNVDIIYKDTNGYIHNLIPNLNYSDPPHYFNTNDIFSITNTSDMSSITFTILNQNIFNINGDVLQIIPKNIQVYLQVNPSYISYQSITKPEWTFSKYLWKFQIIDIYDIYLTKQEFLNLYLSTTASLEYIEIHTIVPFFETKNITLTTPTGVTLNYTRNNGSFIYNANYNNEKYYPGEAYIQEENGNLILYSYSGNVEYGAFITDKGYRFVDIIPSSPSNGSIYMQNLIYNYYLSKFNTYVIEPNQTYMLLNNVYSIRIKEAFNIGEYFKFQSNDYEFYMNLKIYGNYSYTGTDYYDNDLQYTHIPKDDYILIHSIYDIPQNIYVLNSFELFEQKARYIVSLNYDLSYSIDQSTIAYKVKEFYDISENMYILDNSLNAYTNSSNILKLNDPSNFLIYFLLPYKYSDTNVIIDNNKIQGQNGILQYVSNESYNGYYFYDPSLNTSDPSFIDALYPTYDSSYTYYILICDKEILRTSSELYNSLHLFNGGTSTTPLENTIYPFLRKYIHDFITTFVFQQINISYNNHCLIQIHKDISFSDLFLEYELTNKPNNEIYFHYDNNFYVLNNNEFKDNLDTLLNSNLNNCSINIPHTLRTVNDDFNTMTFFIINNRIQDKVNSILQHNITSYQIVSIYNPLETISNEIISNLNYNQVQTDISLQDFSYNTYYQYDILSRWNNEQLYTYIEFNHQYGYHIYEDISSNSEERLIFNNYKNKISSTTRENIYNTNLINNIITTNKIILNIFTYFEDISFHISYITYNTLQNLITQIPICNHLYISSIDISNQVLGNISNNVNTFELYNCNFYQIQLSSSMFNLKIENTYFSVMYTPSFENFMYFSEYITPYKESTNNIYLKTQYDVYTIDVSYTYNGTFHNIIQQYNVNGVKTPTLYVPENTTIYFYVHDDTTFRIYYGINHDNTNNTSVVFGGSDIDVLQVNPLTSSISDNKTIYSYTFTYDNNNNNNNKYYYGSNRFQGKGGLHDNIIVVRIEDYLNITLNNRIQSVSDTSMIYVHVERESKINHNIIYSDNSLNTDYYNTSYMNTIFISSSGLLNSFKVHPILRVKPNIYYIFQIHFLSFDHENINDNYYELYDFKFGLIDNSYTNYISSFIDYTFTDDLSYVTYFKIKFNTDQSYCYISESLNGLQNYNNIQIDISDGIIDYPEDIYIYHEKDILNSSNYEVVNTSINDLNVYLVKNMKTFYINTLDLKPIYFYFQNKTFNYIDDENNNIILRYPILANKIFIDPSECIQPLYQYFSMFSQISKIDNRIEFHLPISLINNNKIQGYFQDTRQDHIYMFSIKMDYYNISIKHPIYLHIYHRDQTHYLVYDNDYTNTIITETEQIKSKLEGYILNSSESGYDYFIQLSSNITQQQYIKELNKLKLLALDISYVFTTENYNMNNDYNIFKNDNNSTLIINNHISSNRLHDLNYFFKFQKFRNQFPSNPVDIFNYDKEFIGVFDISLNGSVYSNVIIIVETERFIWDVSLNQEVSFSTFFDSSNRDHYDISSTLLYSIKYVKDIFYVEMKDDNYIMKTRLPNGTLSTLGTNYDFTLEKDEFYIFDQSHESNNIILNTELKKDSIYFYEHQDSIHFPSVLNYYQNDILNMQDPFNSTRIFYVSSDHTHNTNPIYSSRDSYIYTSFLRAHDIILSQSPNNMWTKKTMFAQGNIKLIDGSNSFIVHRQPLQNISFDILKKI